MLELYDIVSYTVYNPAFFHETVFDTFFCELIFDFREMKNFNNFGI